MEFSPTNYKLESVLSGKTFDDTGWMLESPGEEGKTLIRALYEQKQLNLKDDSWGFYKYADWLPISRMLKGSAPPVTYKSEELARELGMSNLWITFSGYWPEKGAMMKTCSFKETEAYAVCGRMKPDAKDILVVASAGNTARSFAQVCSENIIPLLLCVPEDYIHTLWFDKPLNSCVKLVVSRTGSDYFDAIHLSNIVAPMHGFFPEGGAKNIARREGMGTTVLSAVTTIGRIPDYYFQAIGSATGAISAWEANLRLLDDGRYGNNKMKLMVSQNHPFEPIKEAWDARSRQMLPMDDEEARKKVELINAKVLSNRRPNYAVAGGLFDAMSDAGGEVLVASNQEGDEASDLFEQTEGVDIHPAAGIATATLINAVKNKTIDKDALVMLNITGGGESLFSDENELHYLRPSLVFNIDPDAEEVKEKIKSLF